MFISSIATEIIQIDVNSKVLFRINRENFHRLTNDHVKPLLQINQ